jgi:hypothetical protein
MLLACAVPFTSARQAWATMNPRTANTAPAPFVPIQEEEDTEREEAAGGKEKVRTSQPRTTRSLPQRPGLSLPLLVPSRAQSVHV